MGDEFFQRFAGRFFSKYRGVVIRVDDPSHKGRLMLRVPSAMGQEDVGWANASSGGGVNTGDFNCPQINDFVWVEFEHGDPMKPIWSHGPWGTRDGESMLPQHSRGASDDLDYSVRETGNIPPSQFAGTQGNVRAIRAKDGSFLEFDSTPGSERVQLAHFRGSRLEFTPDGGVQEVSTAQTRRRIESLHDVEVAGDEKYFVGGVRTLDVVGNTVEQYAGDHNSTFQDVVVEGKSKEETWSGGHSINTGGVWQVKSQSQGRMSFAGQLAFMIGQNLQATVMENVELSASNATNVVPTAPVITLHGYNGEVILKATDITGLANESIIKLIGNTLPGTPQIKMGGDLAIEPFVKGNILFSLLTTLLTDLATHQHPTGVGPSGIPITAPVYTTLLSQLVTILSLEVFGK